MELEKVLSEMEWNQQPLISDRRRMLSGREFVRAVRNTSVALTDMGVGARKICMLRMTNSVDCVVTLFALLLCDSLVFLANPHDPIKKVSRTIDHFSLFALLTDKPSSLAVQKIRGASSADQSKTLDGVSICVNIFNENDQPVSVIDHRMDAANIAIFSSGSTGEPKAILHKFENLWLNAKMHAESIGIKGSDRIGVILPLYYSYGLVANLLAGFVAGAQVSLHTQNSTIDPVWIDNNKITILSITPYFTQTLIAQLASLRILTVGGDVLHKKQALTLMRNFPDCELYATYGLTEAGPRVSTWRFDNAVFDSALSAPIGKPLEGVELSFMKGRNDQCRYAELVIHTPTRMVGYYYGASQGFDPETNAGEYILTGDLVEVRNDEYFLVGRKKSLITQGGEKIFPAVVENAIREIEGVVDVKVEGVIDEEQKQVAKAIIVARSGITTALVRKKLLQSFPRSQVPGRIELVGAIPRTATGKAIPGMLTQRGAKIDGGVLDEVRPPDRRIACRWNKFYRKEPKMENPVDKCSLLHGAWELKSYDVKQTSGEALDIWGDETSGLLIYLPDGYMSVHIANRRRPKFRENDILSGTIEEIRAAFEGYITYFGTYDYDPDVGVVYHTISESLFPNWSGVTQKRFTSLEGDELVLTTPMITINNADHIMTLEWRRLNKEKMAALNSGDHVHGQKIA